MVECIKGKASSVSLKNNKTRERLKNFITVNSTNVSRFCAMKLFQSSTTGDENGKNKKKREKKGSFEVLWDLNDFIIA